MFIAEEIEAHRDGWWRREPEARVETAVEAEAFIEAVGFCATLTDARRPGPSLYVAVCGRRDAFMPRNVQKDPESSLAWIIKDEVLRRGRVYYAKLAKARTLFVAPRLLPAFNALWGVARDAEGEQLSLEARAILKVLRREWEMGTADLRQEAKILDRARFTRAMDELQRAMKVVPGEVLYEPKFTYIWTLPEGRFPAEMKRRLSRGEALREVARAFLTGAGGTLRGELAKVTGLSRPDAGLGNRALVAEGAAARLGDGIYCLPQFTDGGGKKSRSSSRR
ncbi:MAG TPA: hypothetical protein VM870_02430 [Pyrinomonadaceae bacterium]|jgi:hypothetical protein|nr:hypothetical protein [Pyrinomonadaceae bacterium]